MPLPITKSALSDALNRYAVEIAADTQERIGQEIEIEGILDNVYCEDAYAEDFRALDGVVQGYQGDFTPAGSFQVGSYENRLTAFKTDFNITEKNLETFFGTKYTAWRGAGKAIQDNPFVQELFGDFFMRQWKREMSAVSFKGVKTAIVEGTPTTVLGSCNGFNKVIGDNILGGKLNTFTTGTITPANILEKVNDALVSLGEELYAFGGRIYMSRQMALWYSQAYKKTYLHADPVTANPTRRTYLVNDFDFEIVPILSMSGLGYFIIDVMVDGKTNMIVGKHKNLPDMPVLTFIPKERAISVTGDWFRFYGFRRFEYSLITKVA